MAIQRPPSDAVTAPVPILMNRALKLMDVISTYESDQSYVQYLEGSSEGESSQQGGGAGGDGGRSGSSRSGSTVLHSRGRYGCRDDMTSTRNHGETMNVVRHTARKAERA